MKNTVWQPYRVHKVIDNLVSQTETTFFMGTVTPSVVELDGSVDPFDNQHTLERIRGQAAHVVEGSNSTSSDIVAVNLAAFRIPAEVADNVRTNAEMPNLWRSGAGENYPFFMSCLCGTNAVELTDNVENVDSKAKRRFDPGDILVISGSYFNNGTNTTLDLHLSLNLRFLWSLIR